MSHRFQQLWFRWEVKQVIGVETDLQRSHPMPILECVARFEALYGSTPVSHEEERLVEPNLGRLVDGV